MINKIAIVIVIKLFKKILFSEEKELVSFILNNILFKLEVS